MKVATRPDRLSFQVQFFPGNLDPEFVRLELYADGSNGGAPERLEMKRSNEASWFAADASTARPASDYTPRAIPYFPGAAVPLEASQILWRRP
jgi:starch phosphorylase